MTYHRWWSKKKCRNNCQTLAVPGVNLCSVVSLQANERWGMLTFKVQWIYFKLQMVLVSLILFCMHFFLFLFFHFSSSRHSNRGCWQESSTTEDGDSRFKSKSRVRCGDLSIFSLGEDEHSLTWTTSSAFFFHSSFSFWVWLGSGLEYEMMNKHHHYGGTLNLDMLLHAQIIHQSWSNKEKHFNDSPIVHFVTNRSTLMNQIFNLHSNEQDQAVIWTFDIFCLHWMLKFQFKFYIFTHSTCINYESNFNEAYIDIK